MINLQTTFIKEYLKKYSVEIGILLCFILPPIGILWLMVIGWNHLNEVINYKVSFSINTTSFFFICMALATTGAALGHGNGSYLLAFAMILGYLGLYSFIKDRVTISLFSRYKQLIIIGGVYLIIIGNIVNQLNVPEHVFGLLTGTTFIGTSEDASGRLFGSAYNPNFTSFLLLISLSFLLADLLKRLQERRSLIPTLSLILFFGAGIFQTESRTGVATMFIMIILFLLRLAPKIGIYCLSFMVLVNIHILALIPRSEQIRSSSFVRKEIWENSFKIWKEHPYFGTTSLGFYDAYAHFGEPVPHAHNILLGFFSEYGSVGGLGFLLVFTAISFKFCYLFLIKWKKKKVLLEFFLLSLPILLLTGIFDHPLVSPQTTILIVILVACWDRYTERLPFVRKSIFSLKRLYTKGVYLKQKPISQQMTKTEKNKSV
ncbi:O-antigen ligase family protein [Metabacillus sp. Hm71]|uniref:O-antigen ligase family protein n=1 Tax=Metabacillus sp. Hm71 TaxID=3450743 RepID=UPI003F4418E9